VTYVPERLVRTVDISTRASLRAAAAGVQRPLVLVLTDAGMLGCPRCGSWLWHEEPKELHCAGANCHAGMRRELTDLVRPATNTEVAFARAGGVPDVD
jgi:hypothetical protein